MRYALAVLGLVCGMAIAPTHSFANTAHLQFAAANRDALAQKCRKAVFKKYGRRAPDAEGKKKLYLNKDFVTRQVDACVSSGGRVG